MSQLSRALEKRPNPGKIPMLSDLRDSGEIEQVADIILFVYRPGIYNDMTTWEFDNQANIYLAKQRQGGLGKARLRFDCENVKFTDVDLYHNEED